MEEPEFCAFYDVGCWTGHFVDGVNDFVLWLLEMLLGSVISVIEAIPVPGWLDQAASVSLPDSMLWLSGILQLPFGMTVFVSAYTLRFLIRRIPLIG
tara:strand:+ start:4748 stop:5038 length:291 start_codon:yes stop_codon:yes gene_type:complete